MLSYPHETVPQTGAVFEVADNVLWARLAMPSALDHVNIYFLRDTDGWLIIDTGMATEASKSEWKSLLDGPMKGENINGVLSTHHHYDHIGLAGWLCELLDVPFFTSASSYLSCQSLYNNPAHIPGDKYASFFRNHGLSNDITAIASEFGQRYSDRVSNPPAAFQRLYAGMVLNIGGRDFRVLTGEGHSAEQVMLYQPDDKLFIAADQVIDRISPLIAVAPFEPAGDPLGAFLSSLDEIKAKVPDDVLVLSGHLKPFRGLHTRIGQLKKHHDARLEILRSACVDKPMSAAALIPIVFERPLGPNDVSIAFLETLAHINYLVDRDELRWQQDSAGIYQVHAT